MTADFQTIRNFVIATVDSVVEDENDWYDHKCKMRDAAKVKASEMGYVGDALEAMASDIFNSFR